MDATGTADDFKYNQIPGVKFTGVLLPWKKTVGLQLRVRKFSPREGGDKAHSLTLHDSDSGQTQPLPAEFYAIPANTLPTLQELEKWAMDTVTTFHANGFLGGLRASFLSFALLYSECEADIPLVSLN